MSPRLVAALAFALQLCLSHTKSPAHDIVLKSELGEDVEASPADRAAEKAHKKKRWLEGEFATQRAAFDRWEAGGLADAAKSASIGRNRERENEWKVHVAGGPVEKQGAYASGTYAADDNDWEKKLGGFPASHIAKEKEEKVALAEQNSLRKQQLAALYAEEAKGKKASCCCVLSFRCSF